MADQQHSRDDMSSDVVIIGLGPVGATLANLLGLCGITTVVLEREANAYHLPRAVHFDDEIMRVFETIGLSDRINRDVILSPGMRFVDSDGRLILDWSRPPDISPLGWYPSYRFHQPDLERVLRDGLSRWPSVAVRNRCDVFALDQDADGVTVRFEDLSNGHLLRCRTQYVVGCDGARSVVRRFMGSMMRDLGFHERWLVIDAVLKRPRPDLGDYSLQHCDPVRPVTYVRGTGNRRRWEITLQPDENSHDMSSPARAWALLEKWIGPDDADLERAAVYTFHSVIAERWRAGRLVLAGDSAHQTPPFLGQGMCAGIRDVANLGWKLARIIHGLDGDVLLDSYETERIPHVSDYIELAIKLGGVINTKATSAGLPDGERDADRPPRMESRKPPLGPGLSTGRHRLSGELAPQPVLADGVRLDAAIGYRFALLTTPGLLTDIGHQVRQQINNHDVIVIDENGRALQDWLSAQGAQAVLVRPDRYILGAAHDANDLKPLLDALDRLSLPLPAIADPIRANHESREEKR